MSEDLFPDIEPYLITYKDHVLPIVKNNYEEILKNAPLKYPMSASMYLEALCFKILLEYTEGKFNIKNYKLSDIINLLALRPFFLNVVQSNMNITEWSEYREELKNEIINIYGSFTLTPLAKLKNTLEINLLDISKVSNIFMYSFFTLFDSFKTNIHYKDIEQYIKDVDKIVLINLVLNNKYEDSLIQYSDAKMLKSKILSMDIISDTTVHVIPESINNLNDKPFVVFDKKMNKSDLKIGDVCIILLDYGHDSKINYPDRIKKCGFTMLEINRRCLIDVKPHIKKYIEEYINPCPISPYLLQSYIQTEFYNSLSSGVTSTINDIKAMYASISKIVHMNFSQDRDITIQNIYAKTMEAKILNEAELPYFKTYLKKIRTLDPYNTTYVSDFVTSYIYPDIMTDGQIRI